MAKYRTEAMDLIERRNQKYRAKHKRSTPLRESWIRFKRNRTAIVGLVLIVLLLLIAIFANVLAPYDYAKQDYLALNQKPSAAHWFGTDNLGRDILSRCIIGARYSLPIGFVSMVTSMLVGGLLGVVGAYFGGRTDEIIMRLMDIFQSIPGALMSIAVIAALGNGVFPLVLAITISFMPACAKVCRAAIFTVKRAEYVESSRAIGAGGVRLMCRHMIPNAVGTIIIFAVSVMASCILIVSTLSYLGLGLPTGTPEWGSLLSSGKDFIRSYPHMVLFPGLMIMLTLFAFNLFGDGLRDALDPRLK